MWTEGWFIPTVEFEWVKLKVLDTTGIINAKINFEMIGCYKIPSKFTNILLRKVIIVLTFNNLEK